MAEDKNKQTPQPAQDSALEKATRVDTGNFTESIRSSYVTSTLKPPENPSRNGGDKKD